jgi:hypothetical protein
MAVLNAIGRLFRRLQHALYGALASANGPFGSGEWRNSLKDDQDRPSPDR